ncbi:MAG TPA: phosphatidate cytidylyltransferase [Verrucomicrobiaceae bacterium]|jgi:phosphatidate cytidylyltransferase
MNFSSPITRHFLLGILGILVCASLAGFILGRLAKSEGAKGTVSNLNARINSWWIMVLILLGTLASGPLSDTMVFALISFLALREFITATPTRHADYWSLFTAFFIVLPFQYWLVHCQWYGMFTIMIPVYAFVVLPILMVLRGDATDFLERAARTQWGLMVCVYFISHIPMMMHLPFPPLPLGNEGLILFLVIVVQGSDVLQYIWGKLCGRHPVAPRLSPKKTWEGLLGGVLSASALGAALHWLTPCNAVQAFVLAFILCLLGFFGGLVMSAIKRARGIKDWGTLIEGHGGMMDRIDSLCFSAPLYFHLLAWYFGV